MRIPAMPPHDTTGRCLIGCSTNMNPVFMSNGIVRSINRQTMDPYFNSLNRASTAVMSSMRIRAS